MFDCPSQLWKWWPVNKNSSWRKTSAQAAGRHGILLNIWDINEKLKSRATHPVCHIQNLSFSCWISLLYPKSYEHLSFLSPSQKSWVQVFLPSYRKWSLAPHGCRYNLWIKRSMPNQVGKSYQEKSNTSGCLLMNWWMQTKVIYFNVSWQQDYAIWEQRKNSIASGLAFVFDPQWLIDFKERIMLVGLKMYKKNVAQTWNF